MILRARDGKFKEEEEGDLEGQDSSHELILKRHDPHKKTEALLVVLDFVGLKWVLCLSKLRWVTCSTEQTIAYL